MAALIALAAVSLFAAGVIAGIIGVVSVAIRREERNLTLTSEATDHVTRAGRWLNGLYVRAPRRAAAADRETTLV
jgi:protein-S-isoprenylcysteine O-methyltransferase Ste14